MGQRQNGPLGLNLQLDGAFGPALHSDGLPMRLVLPGPVGTPDWHIAAGLSRSLHLKHLDPPTGLSRLDKFKQRLIAKQVQYREDRGATRIEGLTKKQLGPIPGVAHFQMQKDIAVEFGNMWKALKKAYDARPDRSPRDSVGIASTYRSADEDGIAWLNAFPIYAKATHEERLATGDEFGDKALKIIFHFMNGKKAPPGFSGHTHGIAADLTTTEGGHKWQVISAYAHQIGWQTTWLYAWLAKHAWEFHFYQLKTETWHWEYHEKEPTAGSQCWGGKVPKEARHVPKPKPKS